MNKFWKRTTAVALGLALAASIYETALAWMLRGEKSRLEKLQSVLAGKIEEANRERDEAGRRLAGLRAENARLDRDTPEVLRLRSESGLMSREKERKVLDPDAAGAKAWITKVRNLKQRFEDSRKESPEIALLKEEDYLEESAGHDLESDEDYRMAMSELRLTAKLRLTDPLISAFKQFAEANNGQTPSDLQQLAPYLQPPFDSVISGFALAQPGWVAGNNGIPAWAVVEQGCFTADGFHPPHGSYLADPQYDAQVTFISSGARFYCPSSSWPPWINKR